MEGIRQFGTEISGNRQKNEELSCEARAAILSAVAAGQPKKAVAAAFGCTRSTVYNTINRWTTTYGNKSRPRKGRPKQLTLREERYIYRMVRYQPQRAYATLAYNLGCSRSTAQRILNGRRLRKWLSLGRPALKVEDARKRLEFARYWLRPARLQQFLEVGGPTSRPRQPGQS